MKNYYIKKANSSLVYGVSLRESRDEVVCKIHEINVETQAIVRIINFYDLKGMLFDLHGNLDMNNSDYSDIPKLMAAAAGTNNYKGMEIGLDDIKILDYLDANTNDNSMEGITDDIIGLCRLVVDNMFKDGHTVEEKIIAIHKNVLPIIENYGSDLATKYCLDKGFEINGPEWSAYCTLMVCKRHCLFSKDLVY